MRRVAWISFLLSNSDTPSKSSIADGLLISFVRGGGQSGAFHTALSRKCRRPGHSAWPSVIRSVVRDAYASPHTPTSFAALIVAAMSVRSVDTVDVFTSSKPSFVSRARTFSISRSGVLTRIFLIW